jgi:hypothetical protein
MCLETHGNSGPRPAAFDADTIDTIGIDNHCSKCISNVRSDFIGKLIKEIKTIWVSWSQNQDGLQRPSTVEDSR